MYIYKLLFFIQMKERWSSLKSRICSCSKQDNCSFNSSLLTPKKGKEPNLPGVVIPLLGFWLCLDVGNRYEVWVSSHIRDSKRFVAAAQRSPRCSSCTGFLIGGSVEVRTKSLLRWEYSGCDRGIWMIRIPSCLLTFQERHDYFKYFLKYRLAWFL